MGLDMYLYAEKYTSQYTKGVGTLDYPEKLKVLSDGIEKRNFKSIIAKYKIGYWRKFNALHGFIIKNYAKGEDDGHDVWLSERAVNEILDVCEKVLADLNTCPYVEKKIQTMFDGEVTIKEYDSEVARELLPTCSGFFFGVLEYDEYYKLDLEYTIKLLKQVKEIQDEYEIYYSASW